MGEEQNQDQNQTPEMTQEESTQVKRVMFETDEAVYLRDGKVYKVMPCMLGDALELIDILGTVDINAVLLNFVVDKNDPEGEEKRNKRVSEFYNGLLKAFANYPEVTEDYLKQYCDVNTARDIFDVLVGINGLKK